MPFSDKTHGGPIVRKIVTICNKRGLHARAAAKLVKLAGAFDAEVKVAKNGSVVSGLSIMGLMMLAAATGTSVEIRATGPQAAEAVEAIGALIAGGFDEED
ncbi:MAG TPA: HPr family phosphocarrier protein [Aliidongia sp.]|nr:HPr family phosphocarrier protein [Aliidongia sp.]